MYHEYPNQNIPENQKDNVEFHKKHIYAFVESTATPHFSKRAQEITELTYAIMAKASPNEAEIINKTLTQQYGDDFNVKYEIYPLIEQKLEDAIGNYRLRPLRSKTAVVNKTAVSSKLQEIVAHVTESMERDVNSSLEQQIQAETGLSPELGSSNPDVDVPDLDKIDEFIANYRTETEKIGEDVLDYILNAKGEKEAIYNAAMIYLAFGEVGIFIEEKNGNPSLYVPHPLEFYCDKIPNKNIQDDAELVALDQWFSQNEILNKFNLTDKEKKKLDSIFKCEANKFEITNEFSFGKDVFVRNINGLNKCRVVTLFWKSRRKNEYKTFENKKSNKKESVKINSKTKAKDKQRIIDNDELEVVDIENIRHITMIGHDLVLSWGSLKDQIKSVGDPRKRFIPFVNITSDNFLRTGEVRSMARKLKFLQDFASEILWEIRFNIRQMDGNVLVYDTAMFPKELFGDLSRSGNRAQETINKVMRLLKKERVMFINSKDKRSNHYASSVNVSQKGRAQDLLQMFALIEQLADKICGIPSQQANQVYQKATVAELQAQNTTSRLEEYFGEFESGIERALNYLTAKGQQLYKKNDILSFIGGDGAQKFIQVTEEWANDDLGVKFVNNRKDYESKQTIDQAAVRIMSSANNVEVMTAMLDVLDSENYEQAKTLLVKYQNYAAEQAQAMQEREAEMAKAEQDFEQAKIDNDNLQKEKDRQNNIDVAEIYANNKMQADTLRQIEENNRKGAELEFKHKELESKQNQEKEKTNQ